MKYYDLARFQAAWNNNSKYFFESGPSHRTVQASAWLDILGDMEKVIKPRVNLPLCFERKSPKLNMNSFRFLKITATWHEKFLPLVPNMTPKHHRCHRCRLSWVWGCRVQLLGVPEFPGGRHSGKHVFGPARLDQRSTLVDGIGEPRMNGTGGDDIVK